MLVAMEALLWSWSVRLNLPNGCWEQILARAVNTLAAVSSVLVSGPLRHWECFLASFKDVVFDTSD